MDLKSLGSNIRKYRLEKGITQETAAEQSGISTVYFRQIELGLRTPKLETFLKIAEAIDTPTDKLLSGNVSWTDTINTYGVIEKLDMLSEKERVIALNTLDTLITSLKEM